MNPDDAVGILSESGAMLEGHFELRSGLHSDRFFQFANVLRYPEHAGALCGALASLMRFGMGDEFDVDTVIAPALGGIVVGHELARRLGTKSIFAEKQDDALVLRRFDIQPGEKCVVAEDVITRGGRVQETIDIVLERGGEVVAVGVLLDRSGGKARVGVKLISLARLKIAAYEADNLPPDLAAIPAIKPGSRGLK